MGFNLHVPLPGPVSYNQRLNGGGCGVLFLGLVVFGIPFWLWSTGEVWGYVLSVLVFAVYGFIAIALVAEQVERAKEHRVRQREQRVHGRAQMDAHADRVGQSVMRSLRERADRAETNGHQARAARLRVRADKVEMKLGHADGPSEV